MLKATQLDGSGGRLVCIVLGPEASATLPVTSLKQADPGLEAARRGESSLLGQGMRANKNSPTVWVPENKLD